MSEQPPCILVVDDDDSNTRLMELAFRGTNAEVVAHNRAFGVLQLIATHRPVVVILDVMMPGLDGPSLVELVRDDPELRGTRIVLWSAMDKAALEQAGAQCGADGVVEKTRGPRALVDQISSWLSEWDGVVLG
jgi:putative two-component system response regulator